MSKVDKISKSMKMVKICDENIYSKFDGTIIDLETIGSFLTGGDSRRYREIIPVIFGFINKNGLKIYCAKNEKSIGTLKQNIHDILPRLKKPFMAFNCDFERGVLFHYLSKPIEFDGELQKIKFEKKKDAVKDLKIPNYSDPFYDNGTECMNAWSNGDIDDAIAHNRSCLLKERDILLKRGSRKPDELKLVP